MRLVDRGLIERDPSMVIRWGASNKSDSRIGHSSVLMKTIVVNPWLDTEDISENALDFALYSQISHTNLGFGTDRTKGAEKYRSMIAAYPERESAENELRNLGLGI